MPKTIGRPEKHKREDLKRPVSDISSSDVVGMLADEMTKRVQDFQKENEQFIASNEEEQAKRWNQKLDPYKWDAIKREWVKR